MNPLFVGIDVSSRNNVAYLMKPDGSKHSSFSIQNNLGGAKLLSEKIVSALRSMQLSDVVIGLEATSIYGDSLVYALREDGSLGRFQRKIHVLNPKQVKKFKEAYPDLPKNDFVDAFVIADHLRFGRIAKEVYMDDYRYQALRTLTRARFDVIQNLTREKQRFANYLFLKCSGIAQDKDIQNTSATISFDGRCPTCHGDRVRLSGIGTQKLEEELSSLFPEARVLRMDADTTYSRYAYEESFSEFANGAYDIMVGTQMIAKGLDFPNVTTVGVISLDSSLFAGDFRSYERTFSLLTQVAGRGGRGDSEAVAYIQTFVPDHHVIALAAKQDYKGFFEQEIALRRELIYPPFCDICTVYFCSAIESDAVRAAHEFVSMMRQKIADIDAKFPLRVLGPAKSGYGRINNRYKYALTIKCRMSSAFRSFISELLADTYKNKTFSNTRVYVDINGET